MCLPNSIGVVVSCISNKPSAKESDEDLNRDVEHEVLLKLPRKTGFG